MSNIPTNNTDGFLVVFVEENQVDEAVTHYKKLDWIYQRNKSWIFSAFGQHTKSIIDSVPIRFGGCRRQKFSSGAALVFKRD